MQYERFRWNETRGDQYDDWGYSTFWMERGEDGYATRQMEVYDNGNVLKYDSSHLDDQYGMLSDVEFTADEFEESRTGTHKLCAKTGTFNKLAHNRHTKQKGQPF